MSDYATQLERACGAGLGSAEAKQAVGHSQRIEADIEDLEPAGEVIESLASDCAKLINRLGRSETIEIRTMLRVLGQSLKACDALDHLYARAKKVDQDRATELLNQ